MIERVQIAGERPSHATITPIAKDKVFDTMRRPENPQQDEVLFEMANGDVFLAESKNLNIPGSASDKQVTFRGETGKVLDYRNYPNSLGEKAVNGVKAAGFMAGWTLIWAIDSTMDLIGKLKGR